ncbi:transmembrane 4 L6 family member 1-like [Salarias fasciatus]|uniref:Transmembrane 4 L6 family member 1-like n=1 Tax=Salarias fasciatus TaxID=181472 RepID=A0A672JUX9_SALFA|nr:transmembrane 4 L6 family member 1-like [Salarias fasciatus]
MCTGKCSRCVAVSLYPLVLLSIICNIVLFFPGWDVKYAREHHLTAEVTYMGGLFGGGFLVLIPALYIHLTGEGQCCGNRFGMFFSIAAAAVGVLGAGYSFVVAILGLTNGPLCKTDEDGWTRPFLNSYNSTYLTNHTSWAACTEPSRVVQFNTGLFLTLLAASSLQGALCAIQMINGLAGCLCGVCSNEKET